ncbi:MAG TPA: isoprenylcysteine carboxylmethyltransferase family protein [Terriglobales bacterium]|nr:isoprenylcysteine carboxylmethyltransferase family protein [Terriglobales bacterium]
MEGPTFRVFLGFQIVAVIVLLAVLLLSPGPWNWQRVIGSALAVTGIAGVFTARYQLGHSFSIMPQARKLVTHGLYSRIRNPIYLFGSVAFAGVILVWRLRWGWILLLAVIALQTLRARKEARVLEAKFGDDYRRYRGQTWF